MDSNGILIVMILVCLALIFIMLLAKPIKFMLRFMINGALGALGLLAVNFILQPMGFTIGINLLTMGFIGLLGLPGFGALLLINALL